VKRSLPPTEVHPGCSGLRTILVPPDIVAVPRRSPPRVRKRTPWHPQPDGAVATPRAGEREWFGDRVFVEAQAGHARSGYGVSLLLHVCAVIPLIAFLMTRPDQLIIVALSPGVEMPAFPAPPPTSPTPETASQTVNRPTAKVPAVAPAAAAPPPAADVNAAAAPVDPPSQITPETGAENGVPGLEGGVTGGVAGGVVGGVGNVVSGSGPPGPITVRVGTHMKPPRKTKDVKPVYPPGALPTRAQGAVIIEALIGPDGKVHEAHVVHSVPSLDQAALDAVRRWEYEPSLLNGVAVAVIMTVVVNFALQ
jgi:protein TonB